MRARAWAAVAVGGIGAASVAAYGMFTEQTRRARQAMGPPVGAPLRADGVYLPDGRGPLPPAELSVDDPPLNLAVLGDSTAAGLGVDTPDELPGVLLARGLAEEAGRPVRLDTHALVGSNSRALRIQVDTALTLEPDAALVMVGANDVKTWMPPGAAAVLLGETVAALREAGVAVVVGTCPDLGVVAVIPQPLRSVARGWGLALARMQRDAVLRAGGHPVPLADLLAPEFLTRAEFFSRDRFHPSAAGYEAAVSVLLPALCSALGVWGGGPVPAPPTRSTTADARRVSRRLADLADHWLPAAFRRSAQVRP